MKLGHHHGAPSRSEARIPGVEPATSKRHRGEELGGVQHNDNGKAAILATVDADDQETILNAARACPVAAIIIKDETGKVIFPE